jgi:NAD(P)-dependent dehydrogenase (short-subunit alcohol dehydrogenase family)
MKKYFALTGGATGIGAALKQKLRARGDEVVVVDIRDADIIADLSTTAGRNTAIEALRQMAPQGLDGFIPCAGLGPSVRPCERIAQVNYFGVVALVQGVKPLLAQRRGSVVVISSNSASLPGHHKNYVKALLEGHEDKACEIIAAENGQAAYGGSKYALAVWMRKNAPGYMKESIRMNAVAPGITQTAMTDQVFADATWGDAIRKFNEITPCGSMASPDMIADAILFLLDPASVFVCGAVLFVDGGTDALLRPEIF